MRGRLFVIVSLIFCFMLPAASWAAGQFRVVKVESWDTLNMRSGPGVKNSVVEKLPHNAKNLSATGARKTVGKTHWVEVSWQGKTGWVSKAYLEPQKATTKAQQTSEAEPAVVTAAIVKKKKSGMWILECGNTSPSWKVEILPEWMSGTLGEHMTGMPIIHKRQTHGKYHKVALETEVRGANRWNRLKLTLNYTKSCYSRLTKKKESFSVKGMFNNTEIAGCCRALQVP